MTVTDFIKLLMRNWSKIAFGLLVLMVLTPAFVDWTKKHEAESAAAEKKAALDKVGTDASIAGSMYWEAYKGCRKIGIPNVETCAKYEGTLLQEKAAPMLAMMAVDHRTAYDTSCQKVYAKEYCDQLLNRAFQLSQNEP